MRTLQIGDDWLEERAGGLGRYYYELLRHLPATGTSTHGLVVGSERVAVSTKGKVIAFARPDDPMLKRMRTARRAALQEERGAGIDLIASHFALYALPIVDKLHSIPLVTHFHGPWGAESDTEGAASRNSRFKSFVEKTIYSRARRLIVLSSSFRQELIRRYGVEEDRIRIVPGGIDAERFNLSMSRADARDRLGWPADRPIILTVRRQVKRMGLEDLIDAARQIVAGTPDVLILLGGSGPISGDLHRRIAEYGLEDNVRLLGRIDDAVLPAAYRAADMTVVPSQSLEGFGLITLESLAAGTPVFVTPIGGLPEIVQPFAPECVFANTSANEIAGVLGEALRGARSLPDEIACREYAAGNYSWPHIAEKVRNVYNEAMA